MGNTFGCKHPSEDKLFLCSGGLFPSAAVMEDGVDYVGKVWRWEAWWTYRNLRQKGWIPMTEDDMAPYCGGKHPNA